MTQEDKELLLKDLCARLPYGVKLQNVNNIESIVKLRSIDLDNDCCEILFYTYQGKALTICDKSKLFRFGKILRYKPYLFPLSSITIEQEKELSKLGVSYCEYALHDDIRGLGIYVDEAYIFFEFCYKHHIDFLGLIERGLALDATGLNVY